jgi:hypothetical protein
LLIGLPISQHRTMAYVSCFNICWRYVSQHERCLTYSFKDFGRISPIPSFCIASLPGQGC